MRKKIRRYIRRLFLQKIQFVRQMKAGNEVEHGYLLGTIGVPELYDIRQIKVPDGKKLKTVDQIGVTKIGYFAIVEPEKFGDNIVVPYPNITLLES